MRVQEKIGVAPLLGDAANANDLRDLFKTFPWHLPANIHQSGHEPYLCTNWPIMQMILTRYRGVVECGQVDLEKEITMPKPHPSFTAEFKHEAVQLARTSVNMLPEELREHMVSAGREFTRGLGTFAHELADNFDKIADER